MDVEVTLDVEMGPVASSFGLLLRLELPDELLAGPGDVAGGVRSTMDLISTIAVLSGRRASVCGEESRCTSSVLSSLVVRVHDESG